MNTSPVGVHFDEYELNTTYSLQALSALDLSWVARRCRTTIACISIVHLETLVFAMKHCARSSGPYLAKWAYQRRMIVATSRT
jgi:hypothetical protein